MDAIVLSGDCLLSGPQKIVMLTSNKYLAPMNYYSVTIQGVASNHHLAPLNGYIIPVVCRILDDSKFRGLCKKNHCKVLVGGGAWWMVATSCSLDVSRLSLSSSLALGWIFIKSLLSTSLDSLSISFLIL